MFRFKKKPASSSEIFLPLPNKASVTLNHAVKTTVFLTDINDFKNVNEVYEQYFSASLSTRSAFQAAALHLGAQIEVEAIF